jgi:hypothetical protein
MRDLTPVPFSSQYAYDLRTNSPELSKTLPP